MLENARRLLMPSLRSDVLRQWQQRRCETDRGVQVDPLDAIWAMVAGRVRTIIRDASGNLTPASGRIRFFTGALRDMIRIRDGNICDVRGCGLPGEQIDHLTPHSHGGATRLDNGGPTCAFHNRGLYQHHIRTHRDQHGHWHHTRPDGTEIAPRPQRPRPKPDD